MTHSSSTRRGTQTIHLIIFLLVLRSLRSMSAVSAQVPHEYKAQGVTQKALQLFFIDFYKVWAGLTLPNTGVIFLYC